MIRWFAQEHPASCVAACVRMVLTAFGQQRSEPEIRQMLGNPRFGVTLRTARQKLIEAGAIAQWHDDWELMTYAIVCAMAMRQSSALSGGSSVTRAPRMLLSSSA